MSPLAPFRPTMRLAANVNAAVLKSPVTRTAPRMIIPGLVVVGAVSGVVAYVRTQLRKESETMNRMFSQQNTAEVRARRDARLLVNTEGNPRKTVYNILNW
ncbi:hypothetical protein C8A05DRAFT_39481 [Staphylotrichum tortipilum]|uniref:Uncharacterized protein n=1 Tax=Staphylotrichum tortipilum TaxID=2831512 RepID=A0AAN6MAR6_9PEZI|nr:hypothetical protein C8A05DRAFT_39481 [Staphylotrichum longicolle]